MNIAPPSLNAYRVTNVGLLATLRREESGELFFCTTSQFVIPDAEELDGFLEPKRYLDPRLAADERIQQAAMKFGARRFTINSLIRLRCAGKERQHLATRLDTSSEADRHFLNFPQRWANVERQKRFAHALDVFARKLSSQNREDLRQASTTLKRRQWFICPQRAALGGAWRYSTSRRP